MAVKKQWYTEDDFSKSARWHENFCDIWQNFYLYRISNNEDFKMEVKQTNFVTHVIVQNYYIIYWLARNPSVKISNGND